MKLIQCTKIFYYYVMSCSNKLGRQREEQCLGVIVFQLSVHLLEKGNN